MRTWVKLALPAVLLLGALPGKGQEPGAKEWIGRKAEAFALPDADGRKVDIAKLIGKKPVVLVFYRGVW